MAEKEMEKISAWTNLFAVLLRSDVWTWTDKVLSMGVGSVFNLPPLSQWRTKPTYNNNKSSGKSLSDVGKMKDSSLPLLTQYGINESFPNRKVKQKSCVFNWFMTLPVFKVRLPSDYFDKTMLKVAMQPNQ